MGNGTPLGQVRGLGSSRSGTHHFTLSRLTAIGNLVLLTWLIVSLVTGDVSSHDSLLRWIKSPLAAAPMVLLVICAITHLRLGLTTLIEDYVHGEATKLASLVLLTFFSWGSMIFALVSIATIVFGAAPHVGQ
jgi:succinate dehydrogenase / fumarate reductase membrane anchor subunit